jgi:hypothetical protein
MPPAKPTHAALLAALGLMGCVPPAVDLSYPHDTEPLDDTGTVLDTLSSDSGNDTGSGQTGLPDTGDTGRETGDTSWQQESWYSCLTGNGATSWLFDSDTWRPQTGDTSARARRDALRRVLEGGRLPRDVAERLEDALAPQASA